MTKEETTDYRGYCPRCKRVHSLDGLHARIHALQLMENLDTYRRLDFLEPAETTHAVCSTDFLFGEARGKMFGVLSCEGDGAKEVVLYAFSGQFNGRWLIPGWVGPVFDENSFHRCNTAGEREIKALGRAVRSLTRGSREWRDMRQKQRERSRTLMAEIFSLYKLPNFRGEERALREVFTAEGGIPTGTGDCCAPKLLAHAARNRLRPLSLAEFYFGRNNISGGCRHRQFYPPCTARCRPILGHLLCGVDELGHQ